MRAAASLTNALAAWASANSAPSSSALPSEAGLAARCSSISVAARDRTPRGWPQPTQELASGRDRRSRGTRLDLPARATRPDVRGARRLPDARPAHVGAARPVRLGNDPQRRWPRGTRSDSGGRRAHDRPHESKTGRLTPTKPRRSPRRDRLAQFEARANAAPLVASEQRDSAELRELPIDALVRRVDEALRVLDEPCRVT